MQKMKSVVERVQAIEAGPDEKTRIVYTWGTIACFPCQMFFDEKFKHKTFHYSAWRV